jgi:adhesin transport system membrane fusion protein
MAERMTDKDAADTRDRAQGSALLWVLLIGLAAALAWASVYRIDEVTRASGTVIASTRVQIVQAVDGGVLQSLQVREGDRVEAGQEVARLDQTRFQAGVEELRARVAALKAQAARLRAEVLGAATVRYPPDATAFPELIKVQQALFMQRKVGLEEELRTLAVARDLARRDADLVRKLEKSGDVSQSEAIRVERALNEAQASLINRRNRHLQEASAELARAEADIAQNEQVLAQRQQQLDDTVLRASVPGIVKNVRVTTQGGVLRAGDELLQIVPVGEALIVEARVQPADIARVRIGLNAGIRFDPYDYTVYGAVDGEVRYVSADTIKDEGRGGEQAYYRIHVATEGNPLTTSIGRQIDIQPGMTAQVDIRTGDRTVMDYLLKPLRKTLAESLGER